MDQGDDGGLERALDDIDGRVESFKGDGAAVVQVQGGGDDHYVIAVGARARLILIPDPIQGFPLWTEREENTKVNFFLGFYPLPAIQGPAARGQDPGCSRAVQLLCQFIHAGMVAGRALDRNQETQALSLAVALTSWETRARL